MRTVDPQGAVRPTGADPNPGVHREHADEGLLANGPDLGKDARTGGGAGRGATGGVDSSHPERGPGLIEDVGPAPWRDGDVRARRDGQVRPAPEPAPGENPPAPLQPLQPGDPA